MATVHVIVTLDFALQFTISVRPRFYKNDHSLIMLNVALSAKIYFSSQYIT